MTHVPQMTQMFCVCVCLCVSQLSTRIRLHWHVFFYRHCYAPIPDDTRCVARQLFSDIIVGPTRRVPLDGTPDTVRVSQSLFVCVCECVDTDIVCNPLSHPISLSNTHAQIYMYLWFPTSYLLSRAIHHLSIPAQCRMYSLLSPVECVSRCSLCCPHTTDLSYL